MKDKNFIVTITILLSLIIFFFIIMIVNSNKKEVLLDDNSNYNTYENSNNEIIEKSNTKEKEEITITSEEKKSVKKTKETKDNKSIIIEDENQTTENEEDDLIIETKNEEVYSSNDLKVINEINDAHENVKKTINKEITKEALNICKGVFITYVDFLFFDGEINGIRFDELTSSGKEKVLSLINKTDEYIDTKYPGYKDEITSTTKDVFNKASSLIKKGSEKISNFSKEKLTEEDYKSIIEAKDDLISFTKSSTKVIKNVSINIYNKAKSKLYNWYINLKNKE